MSAAEKTSDTEKQRENSGHGRADRNFWLRRRDGKVEWVIDRDVGYLAELDSASLF